MKQLDGLVRYSLRGQLPLWIFIIAIVMGALSLNYTAREEEPQIVVPVIDVMVEAPGLSAHQVERQVTTPLEKLLAQIPGVEHVYSSSTSGKAIATLRFYVGEDREESILNTYNKLYSNQDKIPSVVSNWMLKPVEVDDVPIMLIGLWSENPEKYDDFELRRLADEISIWLQGIPQTSEVNVVGGRPRKVQIQISPENLAARKTTPLDVIQAIRASNQLANAGRWTFNNQSILLESGDAFRNVEALEDTLVNVINGTPVLLKEVAIIQDGPADIDQHTWIDFSSTHPAYTEGENGYPMVTISVAKQRGSNAVRVAEEVHQLLSELDQSLLPSEIHTEIIRDYGQTANEKVNDLAASLAFAIFTVVIFLGIFLGWRAAAVVGLALPICYGITLAFDLAFGYNINRVTLFALILSLGLLVDDPITGIDNISRLLKEGDGAFKDRIVQAIAEIRTPLLMSTITIALAFLPLAFITGMMGPYMAPMAFNVPVSVVFSTVVAFIVTPWLASKLLRPGETSENVSGREGIYRRIMSPILHSKRKSKAVLWGVLVLFVATALLPAFRLVPLKLLPFDNKNEVQIILDMPRGSSLELTAGKVREISSLVRQLPEIQSVSAFVGTASPIDFNGMVRQHYLRQATHQADLRLNLVDKSMREHQSHSVVLRLRQLLAPLYRDQVKIKVVEVPPGPPVMSTLVVEVYGSKLTSYEQQEQAANQLADRMRREMHVVEVDTSQETSQTRQRFITDKNKAALSGISTSDINTTLSLANAGLEIGHVLIEDEARPLPIELRMPPEQRHSINNFKRLFIKGQLGATQQTSAEGLTITPQPMVALGELGQFKTMEADRAILHKDLRPVVYVTAELNGRTPAEVIADLNADKVETTNDMPENTRVTDWQNRSFFNNGGNDYWSVGSDIELKWTGEGEWLITKDVFRDMGLAFLFALIAIFIVLRIQTNSVSISLIIMSAIPLTVIGIMPGFWLLNSLGERTVAGAPDPVLFTATAMIGMIALAGIVVRNSLILVEYINQSCEHGTPLREALINAGSIRMRPILLTAGTTLLGNLVITLDPVFSGLAIAIIFGIIASTLFTLIVIPVVYHLVFCPDDPFQEEAISQ
jgi:multidrug efflux pump subunit AcrB